MKSVWFQSDLDKGGDFVSSVSWTVAVGFIILVSTKVPQSIPLLLQLVGSCLLPVTLVLFPIIIFNKAMRHLNSSYKALRYANWVLFVCTVAAGGFTTYKTI